ncbi:MAG: hypothetical protein ACRCR9_03490 [Chitinophagaceae bacterium]
MLHKITYFMGSRNYPDGYKYLRNSLVLAFLMTMLLTACKKSDKPDKGTSLSGTSWVNTSKGVQSTLNFTSNIDAILIQEGTTEPVDRDTMELLYIYEKGKILKVYYAFDEINEALKKAIQKCGTALLATPNDCTFLNPTSGTTEKVDEYLGGNYTISDNKLEGFYVEDGKHIPIDDDIYIRQ